MQTKVDPKDKEYPNPLSNLSSKKLDLQEFMVSKNGVLEGYIFKNLEKTYV